MYPLKLTYTFYLVILLQNISKMNSIRKKKAKTFMMDFIKV